MIPFQKNYFPVHSPLFCKTSNDSLYFCNEIQIVLIIPPLTKYLHTNASPLFIFPSFPLKSTYFNNLIVSLSKQVYIYKPIELHFHNPLFCSILPHKIGVRMKTSSWEPQWLSLALIFRLPFPHEGKNYIPVRK